MSTQSPDGEPPVPRGHASTADKFRIDTQDGSQADPVEISRGIFGATIGIDRLLKLFGSYNIRASWYVPAHTAESFPDQVAKIVNAGHEM